MEGGALKIGQKASYQNASFLLSEMTSLVKLAQPTEPMFLFLQH